jgi:hypothetical protein
MKPPKEFLILIGKKSLYFGEGRHKDTRNLQKGEVKGSEIELYIANLLRRILNLQLRKEILTREDISRLGRMLYNFLREWNLDVAFRRFYREIAETADGTVPFGRIYLEFGEDADLLAVLPWEFLSYGDGDHFLGAHKDFKFDLIRRNAFSPDEHVFSYAAMPVPKEQPRVLLLQAEPLDPDFAFDGDRLLRYFEHLNDSGRIALRVISQAAFDDLPAQIDALKKEGFAADILHLALNGQIYGNKGYIGLIDPGDERKVDWVEDRNFIDIIQPLLGGVQLVYLHSCQGGMVGDYARKSGLGLQLLRKKIPALVALQAPVQPHVAYDFAEVFYEAILRGDDVARAVTAGRKKLCFELQAGPDQTGEALEKRVNPYGEKSFGIPLVYITTEEPFSLFPPPEPEKPASAESHGILYYECQNRPMPRCFRIKLVEPDEQGCPVCGGALIAVRKADGSESGRAQPAQGGGQQTGKSKASQTPAGPIYILPESQKRRPSNLVILFLASNPKDTSRLRLDEEARRIEDALERSKHRDQFQLIKELAPRIEDLRRALLDHAPAILHFSGHGTDLGEIYLEDASGNAQAVSAEALGSLLELFKEHLKVVVMNACFSELQARQIIRHGIPVIGMRSAVPDQAGVEFSVAFYDALGAGRSVDFAYRLGCIAIDMYNLKKEDIPVLLKPE